MAVSAISFLLLLFSVNVIAQASFCPLKLPGVKCPTISGNNKREVAICSSQGSLKSNVIFDCTDGCPTPGNCQDHLAGSPLAGSNRSLTSLCWEEKPGDGNAQCTTNCVKVIAANGSSIYPLGCDAQTSSAPPPRSTSLSLANSATETQNTAPPPTSLTSSTTSGIAAAATKAGEMLGMGVAVGIAVAVL